MVFYLTGAQSSEMNVLHITNAYPCASTPEYGVFVKEQIDALYLLGVSQKVIFINRKELGLSAYLTAIKEIRSHVGNFDVIHCHHLLSFFALVIATISQKKPPVVLSFLNAWGRETLNYRYTGFLSKLLSSFAVSLADLVIFKCPIPEKYLSNPKIVNLPNGVMLDEFCPIDEFNAKLTLGLDVNYNYILFVGSKNIYRKQKRYDLFEKVLHHTEKLRPDLKVRELKLVGVRRENVKYYFGASKVHLLTSDYEGSPNSVKEAMAMGTKVVSRAVGNVANMTYGVPGTYVVNSDCVDEISSALVKALDNTTLASDIVSAFKEKGLDSVSVSRKLLGLYNDLLQKSVSD